MRLLFFVLFIDFSDILIAQSIFDSTKVICKHQVYFETGEWTLNAEETATLDSIWTIILARKNDCSIQVQAHTDDVGNEAANLELSKKRAASVEDFFVQKGISSEKITASFHGEALPVSPNQTEIGRASNRRVEVKIVEFLPMKTLSGKLQDEKTGEGIEAWVMFSSKTRSDSVMTDTSGQYSVRLPKDSVIRMEVQTPNYFFESQMLRMFSDPELFKKHFDPNISLKKVELGEKGNIHNLYFIGNKAELVYKSKPELPKVLRFMQINPSIVVEIAGHINHPNIPFEDLEEWEMQLSIDRAKLVYDYLSEHGVSEKRISYKGYGNSEMVYPTTKDEREMAANRRVEIRILKE